MLISPVDFEEICQIVCEHCRKGYTPRYREATHEWVHDIHDKARFAHTMCWAHGLRMSKYAPSADKTAER